MERITAVRYISAISSALVMFGNLIDCIAHQRTALDFLLYVGVLAAVSIISIACDSRIILGSIFALIGTMTMLADPSPNTLGGGIIFIFFAIHIFQNRIARISMYSLAYMSVISNHAIHHRSGIDAVMVLLAYTTFFMIEYFLYDREI